MANRKTSVSKPLTRRGSTTASSSKNAKGNGNQDTDNPANGSNTADSKNDNNCGSCSLIVMEDDSAIECELCGFWFHCTCQNVSMKLYDTINDLDCDTLHWYCRTCNGTAGSMLKMMTSLQTNQSELKTEVSGLRAEVQKCNDKIATSQKNMEKKMEELKKDIPNQGNESNSCSVGNVEKIVANKLDDFVERERRKNNIIIFGVPESQSQNAEVRKKADFDQVCSIIHKDLNVKPDVVPVRTLYRLGKKSDSARPLKVVMENGAIAEEVLRKARAVKLASIQITRDRTKVEREEYKQLRNDLKERTDSGEDDLVIRGGKIVKRTFRRGEGESGN